MSDHWNDIDESSRPSSNGDSRRCGTETQLVTRLSPNPKAARPRIEAQLGEDPRWNGGN